MPVLVIVEAVFGTSCVDILVLSNRTGTTVASPTSLYGKSKLIATSKARMFCSTETSSLFKIVSLCQLSSFERLLMSVKVRYDIRGWRDWRPSKSNEH